MTTQTIREYGAIAIMFVLASMAMTLVICGSGDMNTNLETWRANTHAQQRETGAAYAVVAE